MDPEENNVEQEVKEIFNNIMTKGNIQLNKLYTGDISKGVISFLNKLICNYIKTYPKKTKKENLEINIGKNIYRFITFLSKKFAKIPLDNIYKYSTKNKTRIQKLILLIYLMIYRSQISIRNSAKIKVSEKYLSIKKLYYLLKKMTPMLSKLYYDKIFILEELEIIMKMLIIFTVNDNYKEIKENNDIKNIMYLKECLNIMLMTFRENPSANEQEFLVNIFTYINTSICFMDKNEQKLNYTNKMYMLHNDCKTTKLMKLMSYMHKINNDKLTEIYYKLLSNIYYFQHNYGNFSWDFYELIEPYLKNIKEKDYQTLLKEVSFPEYQLNFIRDIVEKERVYIKDNNTIFKNAFYFSGKQQNSGILANVGNLEDNFLLVFGFNFIEANEPKEEYIVFQLLDEKQKVQLKIIINKNIDNKNKGYHLSSIDSTNNQTITKIKLMPNHYYFFVFDVAKKNIAVHFWKENAISDDKIKLKEEITTSNLLLTVGCNIKKKEKESERNLISGKFDIINSFTGFIGDLFIINIKNIKDKEKNNLIKSILNLKGKYGQTIVKCILEQKLLKEYAISNVEQTSRYLNKSAEGEKEEKNFFKILLHEENFKIIDNLELSVNSLNFRLVEYLDNIDYMNNDNKYGKKEILLTKSKKEQQNFNNYRTNRQESNADNTNKTIEIGSSLFNCNFNLVENTSSLTNFFEEDGCFYIYLVFEYYYQILFRICKDVLSKENGALSKDQTEIVNIIEKGIENYTEFFWKKLIVTHIYIKSYKITLFFYQMNVVIKQFLLIRNINNNLYSLLANFFYKFQNLLSSYIKTILEEKEIYNNLRDFFFEFLLNVRFYKQTEQFDLLNNLNNLVNLLFNTIQSDIGIEKKLLNENVSEKLINFIFFLFKLKDNDANKQLKQKKEDKNTITYRKIKIKYIFLMINYINSIYSEKYEPEKNDKNEKKINPNFLEKYYDRILNNKNEPFIIYYLSLILFLSNVKYESVENYIQKFTKMFEENYTKTDIENKIFSISSMLLITSYYLNFDKNNAEKFKQFMTWYSHLSQNKAYIYFENIYKNIFEGHYEIEELLENQKFFEENKKDSSINFEKRKKKSNSLTSMILSLYTKISGYVGYTNNYEKKGFENKNKKADKKDKKNDIIETNRTTNEDKDKDQEKSLKINIKADLETNAKEIEKIKKDLSKDKYYNDFYCDLDDIKNRCRIENPKSVFIKRNFSHIFYKSLFYCKAFKIIKNIYLTMFPQANAANKQLNYPSKIKNFSDTIGPKLFLRKNFNLYNTQYFPISHDFLTKSAPDFENEDENKKAKLKKLLETHVSDINFYEHRFNINEILELKDRYFDCELINDQFTYFGYIIFGNDYLYFGTKNEEPIRLKDKKLDIDFNYFSRFCFRNYEDYNKTTKKKTIIIHYQDISKIIKRRTLLMYQSLEIYCRKGKNYFFNLYKKEHCENAFKILSAIEQILKQKDKFVFITENTTKEVNTLTEEAFKGKINNYTYLLRLNDLSSRTFNDPNQYPIFPWLFFNLSKIEEILILDKSSVDQFDSYSILSRRSTQSNNPNNPKDKDKDKEKEEEKEKERERENNENVLDVEDLKNAEENNIKLAEKYQIRNFSYPVSLQSEGNRQKYIDREYEPHGKHYSTAGYIFFYLLRNYPFVEAMIQLQNLTKESPNRLFTSMDQCLKVLDKNLENRESIPELFSCFDYYCNLNCAFLGIQGNGNLVDDLRTNIEIKQDDIMKNLYPSYFKYVYIYRSLLNSYLISKYLPLWIDYIFGEKQIEKKKESFFKFEDVSYEQKLKLDEKLAEYIKKYEQTGDPITKKDLKKNINVDIEFINNFGVTPHKILEKPIKLPITKKFKDVHDLIYDLEENIFFAKYEKTILILHKSKKENDKTKKILLFDYEKKNKKYINCGFLKQLEKAKPKVDDSENEIPIYPIYKPCYSMCIVFKFSKIFVLTCRYLGNIFKIQCDEYSIDVLCEDFVSCIVFKQSQKKLEEDDEIFYTGLKNGKLIEWHIKHIRNDDNKLQIKEKKNIYCHRGEITCIEIYENQNVLITGGKDKKIFIRKAYDLELLTVIDLTYCYMDDTISENIDIIPTLIKASELNCIYVLLYNYDSGKSFIRAYNLNGLFIKQSEEDNFMNICFTKNYNLLVSYYGQNDIKVLNCYDLNETGIELYVTKLVEDCEKGNNKRESKGINDIYKYLVWNNYDSKDHEFILLFKNKIVRGNIKDKFERKNLEFY